MTGPPGHRADIDGLRALAILPVVLFHVGAPGFGGGFVGVDVFFVISGFLITGILQRSLDRSDFSLAGFYARRARRILPALAVVAAFTGLAGLVLMTPEDLAALGRDMATTALFVSNLQFARETGYFRPVAEAMPLLHTWSLAIEEQFYAVWPLLLWAVHRFARRRLVWIVAALALGGFALSVGWTRAASADAFFLTPARFWELMLGALLAVWPLTPGDRRLREAAALVGVALIGWSVARFGAGTAVPGPMAALPCLGAALCIAGNQQGDTAVARLLSARPVVFVGLISYSLYLWHWPLLALANYRLMQPPPAAAATAIVILSFVLATLSWRFVEQPFRRGASMRPRRTLALAATAVVALAVAGAGLFLSGGLPGRVDPQVLADDAARHDRSPFDTCKPPPTDRRCRAGPPGPEQVALLGDSHAVAFAPVVERAAAEEGLALRLYTRGACPPLIGVNVARPGYPVGGCGAANARAIASLAANPDVRIVVLVSRWAAYAETTPTGADPGEGIFLTDAVHPALTRADSQAAFVAALERTVAALRAAVGPGGRIIIVEPTPEQAVSAPDCFARRRMWGLSLAPCEGIDRDAVARRQAFVLGAMRDLAARYPEVTTYRLADRLCAGGRCLTRRDGVMLYVDDDHLSRSGVLAVATDFTLSPAAPDRGTQPQGQGR